MVRMKIRYMIRKSLRNFLHAVCHDIFMLNRNTACHTTFEMIVSTRPNFLQTKDINASILIKKG